MMRKKYIGVILSFLSTISIASDLSDSRRTRDFCHLADEFGYESRGYKTSSGGCGTPMVEISKPGGNGLGNNLAFYSTGIYETPEKLKYVSFILNVNNIKNKNAAQKELHRVSSKVALKIFDEIPSDFERIVLDGRSKSWDKNKWEIKVITTKWSTGQGQDTRVIFLPK